MRRRWTAGTTRSSSRLSLFFQTCQQDDVVRGRRARDSEPLAVVRPSEILDATLGEMRELMRWRAVERHDPDVGSRREDVRDPTAIWSPPIATQRAVCWDGQDSSGRTGRQLTYDKLEVPSGSCRAKHQ